MQVGQWFQHPTLHFSWDLGNQGFQFLQGLRFAAASSRPTALTNSLACSLSKHSKANSLVIARPAGFSLWTTPILRLVVMASHTRRKVRDRVFPAPKTPAMAKVDRPVWRAAANESATDIMWALSVRAAMHSFMPVSVARGQYLGVSPVTSSAKSECRLC